MLFLFTLATLVAAQTGYDHLRDYIEAFMKGYENPDYIFPYSTCLAPRTQAEINDKIIGMAFFASNENWAQVNILKAQLKTVLSDAAVGCDVDELINSLSKSYSLANWVTRLWWNSILIYRSWLKFSGSFRTDPLAAISHLGECFKFIFPKQ